MNDSDLSLDLLLQETLALTEYLRLNQSESIQTSFLPEEKCDDDDYLYDLADSLISDEIGEKIEEKIEENHVEQNAQLSIAPEAPGIIYKIDNQTNLK